MFITEHRILEIRERALHGIISKLDRGFLYDNDLARTKEIILKLFKWFSLKPLTNEESVLYLIKRMLLVCITDFLNNMRALIMLDIISDRKWKNSYKPIWNTEYYIRTTKNTRMHQSTTSTLS